MRVLGVSTSQVQQLEKMPEKAANANNNKHIYVTSISRKTYFFKVDLSPVVCLRLGEAGQLEVARQIY